MTSQDINLSTFSSSSCHISCILNKYSLEIGMMTYFASYFRNFNSGRARLIIDKQMSLISIEIDCKVAVGNVIRFRSPDKLKFPIMQQQLFNKTLAIQSLQCYTPNTDIQGNHWLHLCIVVYYIFSMRPWAVSRYPISNTYVFWVLSMDGN